jgi:hypothetical protein
MGRDLMEFALYWFLVCLCTSYQSARNIFINSGESLSFSEYELLVVFGQESSYDCTNSAYDKIGLHYENITFLFSYKINHVSMRVCVLKEYLK